LIKIRLKDLFLLLDMKIIDENEHILFCKGAFSDVEKGVALKNLSGASDRSHFPYFGIQFLISWHRFVDMQEFLGR